MLENLETVRAAYDAMSPGDPDAAFEAAAPDLELIPPANPQRASACSEIGAAPGRDIPRCGVDLQGLGRLGTVLA